LKTWSIAGFSHSGYRATLSVSFGILIFFITFRFVTVAAIFLFAFAFVITDETLVLTAVLFVIAILTPVVTAIFASIVSDNQAGIADPICAIFNVIACQNGAAQKSENA
jgi:hypothetical protein